MAAGTAAGTSIILAKHILGRRIPPTYRSFVGIYEDKQRSMATSIIPYSVWQTRQRETIILLILHYCIVHNMHHCLYGNSFLDHLFALAVKGGGSLVEQQDGRVLDDGACDRNSLKKTKREE